VTEFGREYGEGLYALCAEEGLAEQALKELKCLKGIFAAEPDFLRLLGNFALPRDERRQVLDNALKGQIHPYVLNFLRILVDRGAVSEFNNCEGAYRESYNRANRVLEADVTPARALSEDQRTQLLESLKRRTRRNVTLREHVDPALLGGVLLEMDGKRYDNTLLSRLRAIRQEIGSSPIAESTESGD